MLISIEYEIAASNESHKVTSWMRFSFCSCAQLILYIIIKFFFVFKFLLIFFFQ